MNWAPRSRGSGPAALPPVSAYSLGSPRSDCPDAPSGPDPGDIALLRDLRSSLAQNASLFSNNPGMPVHIRLLLSLIKYRMRYIPDNLIFPYAA
jgi:hypothetical protein